MTRVMGARLSITLTYHVIITCVSISRIQLLKFLARTGGHCGHDEYFGLNYNVSSHSRYYFFLYDDDIRAVKNFRPVLRAARLRWKHSCEI